MNIEIYGLVFATYRTVDLYAFARVIRGEVIRLYAYAGETGEVYLNLGEKQILKKDFL